MCVCVRASAITLLQELVSYACVGFGHVETHVTCVHSLHASAQSLCLQASRENSFPEPRPLLIVLELFNRKPSEI